MQFVRHARLNKVLISGECADLTIRCDARVHLSGRMILVAEDAEVQSEDSRAWSA